MLGRDSYSGQTCLTQTDLERDRKGRGEGARPDASDKVEVEPSSIVDAEPVQQLEAQDYEFCLLGSQPARSIFEREDAKLRKQAKGNRSQVNVFMPASLQVWVGSSQPQNQTYLISENMGLAESISPLPQFPSQENTISQGSSSPIRKAVIVHASGHQPHATQRHHPINTLSHH